MEPHCLLESGTCLDLLPGSCAVAVMAKVPRVGMTKTRLVPPLDLEEAARLSTCLLQDVTGLVETLTSDRVHGYVAYTPAGMELAFTGVLPTVFRLLVQRGRDLGERLSNAANDLLMAGYESVYLLNADSPTLPSALVGRAILALRTRRDVVLGKALDGGYYLIGLREHRVRLFEDITWSSEKVFSQTMERAEELRLDTQVLPAWYDVDDVNSLQCLYEELFMQADHHNPEKLERYSAPHTRNFLQSLINRRGYAALGLNSRPTGRPVADRP